MRKFYRHQHAFYLPWIIATAFFTFAPCQAQNVVLPKSAIVLLESGEIEIENLSGETRTITNNESAEATLKAIPLAAGELIRTTKDSFCDVMIPSVGSMRLTPESEVRLPAKAETDRRKQHSMELLKGKLFMDVDAVQLQRTQRKQFRLKTPTTVLAVRGTQLFAITEDGVDTAGVHEGQIAVLEVTSGRTTALTAGRAVVASPGELAAPRMLSVEEKSYADYYTQFAVTDNVVETAARKAEGEYTYVKQANTAIYENDKKKYTLEKVDVPGIEGKVLRYTFKPNVDFPNDTTRATVTVDISRTVREEPIGIRFSVRTKGVIRMNCHGIVVESRKQNYGIQNPTQFDIPDDTPPGQWVPVFLPVVPDPTTSGWGLTGKRLQFSVDPNLHEERAVPSICQVIKGLPEYQYEITPITVVTKASE